MTNVTDERTESPSATVQVKEKVQDVAEQAKGQTREQLRSQINARSTQAGEQVSSTAEAMRHTSEQLRSDGKDSVAKIVEGAAERSERLGSYLTRADGDQILRDIEDLARKQPWLFVSGSAVVGFLASRFMKASSSTRYQGEASRTARPPWQSDSNVGYVSPAASASTPPDLEGGTGPGATGGGSGELD